MNLFTFDANLFSDLHKDVYGYRPRGHWFYDANTTDQERQEEWNYLCKRLEQQLEEDQKAKAEALRKFEQRVELLMILGTIDREEAIKWIVQSLNPDAIDLQYGGEWVCYTLELAFDQAHMFEKACRELSEELEKLDDDANRHYYAMSFEE